MFMSLYGNDKNLEEISHESLEFVAGGAGKMKKGIALAMALLSLGGGGAVLPNELNLAPTANASWFPKEYSVRSPLDMPQIRKFLVKDEYYRRKLGAAGFNINKLKNIDTRALNNWWNLPGLRENETGGNIGCLHSPEAEQINSAELKAADRLLLYYFDCVAMENGISTSGLSGKISELVKNEKFRAMVNDMFGRFDVMQYNTVLGIEVGNGIRKLINPDIRLMKLIQDRAKHQDSFETSVFISQMKRNAPALTTAAVLFFKLGAIAKIKDLLVQGDLLVKAGVLKAYNRFVYNRLTLERDPVKLKELMREYLKTSVFRQDAAMDKIVDVMSGMADLWASSDKSGVPCTSACTMTFMGDSGVGKTYAARTLSKALFHRDMQPWQFITSTSVTASATSGGKDNRVNLSPADQLFNEKSEIVRQLKLNNRVIVVLDEVDKMHKSDPDDTILERLRDARDTGKLLVRNGVNYDYIDVSRTVFICITNELRQCWGLPEEKLTEAQAAARTFIQRDKSLVNRFDVIEFNYLNRKDYKFILTPELDELKEEYSKEYGIDLNISDAVIEEIAREAEKKNKGVRGINDFLVSLRGKLVDYRSKGKKGSASVTYKDGTFEIV